MENCLSRQTPEAANKRVNLSIIILHLYVYINGYLEVSAERSYKNIEGSGLEMMKMIGPFLARDINKKRHINMAFWHSLTRNVFYYLLKIQLD